MNTLQKLAFAALITASVSGTCSALNTFEQHAQTQMKEFLDKTYDTRIRNDDQSINFMVGENLFWLTMEGNATSMLFTLHRRPIRLDDVKTMTDEELSIEKERAIYAADELSANNPYKAFLRGNRVEFEFPVYATSAVEYKKVFHAVLESLNKVSLKEFKELMAKAKITIEGRKALNPKKAKSDKMVLQQPVRMPNTGGQKQDANVKISRISVRSVDKAGNESIPYGEMMYQNRLQFLQSKLMATADKAGYYEIGMQIINPQGQLMVPSENSDMTAVVTTELKRGNKDIVFDPFGSEDVSVWEPGTYTLVYFVNGKEVFRQPINVL